MPSFFIDSSLVIVRLLQWRLYALTVTHAERLAELPATPTMATQITLGRG